MSVKRFLLIGIIIFLLSFSSFPQNYPQTYELPNGLRVILSLLPDAQATCIFLYHLTGARDEPQDLKGGSMVLSRLMPHAPTQNLERYLRIYSVIINGGSSNFFLNYDYSYSSTVVPENFLQNTLWFESERVNSLKFDPRTTRSYLNMNYFRYTGLLENSITFSVFGWMKSQIFQNTIYGTPLYGDLKNLRNYDPGRIAKLYSNFANPGKILLILCGKFTIPEAKRYINDYFGKLRQVYQNNKVTYKIIKPKEKFFHKNLLKERISQHSIIYGFRAPSRLSYDYIPFKLVQHYLLDKRMSKLEDILLNKNKLEVDISYEVTDNIESNALILEISSPSRLTITKTRYILDQEFASLGKVPIPNSRIRLIKSIMKLDYYKKLGNLEGRCQIIARNYHLYKDLKFEERFLSKLNRITPLDTTKIGKKYFLKNNQTILNVYKK
jgi:zinc protease